MLNVFWGRESINVHYMTFLELTKYFLNQGVICLMFSDSGSHSKLHYTTLYELNLWFLNLEPVCFKISELESQPKLLDFRVNFVFFEWMSDLSNFFDSCSLSKLYYTSFWNYIGGFQIWEWFDSVFLMSVNLKYLCDVLWVN